MPTVFQNRNGKPVQVAPSTEEFGQLEGRVEQLETTGSYVLPPASTTQLGGVKVDGTTITASEDGVISASVGDHVAPATDAPQAPGIAAVGVSDKYAREDHVHPAQDVPALSDAVDSDSSSTAASSNAVKTAYDAVVSAGEAAATAQSAAEDAQRVASSAQEKADSAYVEATKAASTEQAGRVQLSDAVDSDSSTTAATSKAVKIAYDKAVDASGFPAGTRLLFHQAAAPTGWVKQTDVDDAALRVVSGGSGGGTGGSQAFSALFAGGEVVALSGFVGETTLTEAQNGTHHHATVVYPAYGSYGGFPQDNHPGTSHQQALGGSTSWRDSLTVCGTWYSGESESHTHDISGTATIDLNVKYTDVIICQKA